jgi:hypothetical protein
LAITWLFGNFAGPALGNIIYVQLLNVPNPCNKTCCIQVTAKNLAANLTPSRPSPAGGGGIYAVTTDARIATVALAK